MAIIETPVASDIILVMDGGLGTSGQQLSVNRTFRNVKSTATSADIHNVAQSLLGLQSATNFAIQRRDIVELEDDGQ